MVSISACHAEDPGSIPGGCNGAEVVREQQTEKEWVSALITLPRDFGALSAVLFQDSQKESGSSKYSRRQILHLLSAVCFDTTCLHHVAIMGLVVQIAAFWTLNPETVVRIPRKGAGSNHMVAFIVKTGIVCSGQVST